MQVLLEWGTYILHRCLQKAPNQVQLRECNQEQGHANALGMEHLHTLTSYIAAHKKHQTRHNHVSIMKLPLEWGTYILHPGEARLSPFTYTQYDD